VPLFDTDLRRMYRSAVEREVAEEVSLEAGHSDAIVALLNDDSTEVGSVHLGVVHYWILDAPKVNKREQMITQMTFMTPAELHDVRDGMETWSQLCLDGLESMAKKSGLENQNVM
jgi:predicted NUDIX family phosphoesterase